ncbi:MAG: branched-chain amino acid ABC transporter permease [Bosea sp.]|uniref:branched-chain amino acid ABC transporter permease n=1 Tax=Bosea sp. (in: a-proteobacteria) TaxID=1871050 RepID=UPI001ACC582F|nr:branched-chain amino acid ABC transporter permease [Bosea sp. (in: a-proteobacteria)]MBN9451305.1 branched-chain amino acid ABC transporter permease [Bosea sp. (in: a-proteobacteria)]
MTWLSIADATINGTVLGLLIALPALAITLVFGVARFPNAAVGDYMTLGAYTAVASQAFFSGSVLIAALNAMVVTVAVSLFFYFWVFRRLTGRSHISLLISSIGIAFVVRCTITFFAGYDQYMIQTPITRAWNFGGVRILPTDLYVVAAALVALIGAFSLLHLTPTGRKMRALADNGDLAATSGIREKSVMLVLWMLTGAFCGLAGVLLGLKAVVVPELGFELLILMFAAVILGGIGSPVGAVIGALIFGIAQEWASLLVGPPYKIVLAFIVLLTVLLLRPQGILGRIVAVR